VEGVVRREGRGGGAGEKGRGKQGIPSNIIPQTYRFMLPLLLAATIAVSLTISDRVKDHLRPSHAPFPTLSWTISDPLTDHFRPSHAPFPTLSRTISDPLTDHFRPPHALFPTASRTISDCLTHHFRPPHAPFPTLSRTVPGHQPCVSPAGFKSALEACPQHGPPPRTLFVGLPSLGCRQARSGLPERPGLTWALCGST
jgi:hypothetical protein